MWALNLSLGLLKFESPSSFVLFCDLALLKKPAQLSFRMNLSDVSSLCHLTPYTSPIFPINWKFIPRLNQIRFNFFFQERSSRYCPLYYITRPIFSACSFLMALKLIKGFIRQHDDPIVKFPNSLSPKAFRYQGSFPKSAIFLGFANWGLLSFIILSFSSAGIFLERLCLTSQIYVTSPKIQSMEKHYTLCNFSCLNFRFVEQV